MKIKKYEVTDMKEALRLIKQDLGPDAVILTTRKIMKPAGLGLFPKPLLEVTAALDYDKSMLKSEPENRRQQDLGSDQFRPADYPSVDSSYLPPDPTKIIRSQSSVQRQKQQQPPSSYPPGSYNNPGQPQVFPYRPPKAEELLTGEDMHNDISPQSTESAPPYKVPVNTYKMPQEVIYEEKNYELESSFTRSLLENRKKQEAGGLLPKPGEELYIPPKSEEPALKHEQLHSNASAAESLEAVLSTMGLVSIATDLNDIKKQLSEMKSTLQEPVNIGVDLPGNLREIYSVLTRNGLDELLAYRFLKGIEKNVGESSSKSQIKSLVNERIAESIPTEQGYLNLMKGKVMGFVGPTGVGKTTTIAKIAAELVLRHTQKVCLITVDNFRVGAVEQLKTYAEIVNLPLYVASSASDLERLLNNIQGQYEYILLDSTGRSPYDLNKLNETAQYLTASADIVPILVLSMAANHTELGEMYERYSGLDPKYLVFTKLDETRYFGPLANLPIKKKIPLMLFSIGQSVPDDLEVPDGRKIAKKLLQEIPVLWNDN